MKLAADNAMTQGRIIEAEIRKKRAT